MSKVMMNRVKISRLSKYIHGSNAELVAVVEGRLPAMGLGEWVKLKALERRGDLDPEILSFPADLQQVDETLSQNVATR